MTCNESFVQAVWINLSNGTIDHSPDSNISIYYAWNINMAEGSYNYTAYCNDTAGNLAQTETRTLTIDITAPTWDQYPSNVTLEYKQDSLLIDFNASDENNISSYFIISWYIGCIP